MSNRRIARTYAVRARFLLLLAASVPALAGCGVSGTAVPSYSRPLGMAVQDPAAREEEAYVHTLVDIATSLTAENELKWSIVHPEPGRSNFAPSASIVDLARRTGKRV